jgi:hypothetical protein
VNIKIHTSNESLAMAQEDMPLRDFNSQNPEALPRRSNRLCTSISRFSDQLSLKLVFPKGGVVYRCHVPVTFRCYIVYRFHVPVIFRYLLLYTGITYLLYSGVILLYTGVTHLYYSSVIYYVRS